MRPFIGDRAPQAVVPPALLDDARETPLGTGAQLVARAVSTLISLLLAAGLGEWSKADTRQAFAIDLAEKQSAQPDARTRALLRDLWLESPLVPHIDQRSWYLFQLSRPPAPHAGQKAL